MKKNQVLIITVLINLLLVQFINAEIKLPALLSSKMVLQRSSTVALWGWANPNEKLDIRASWIDASIQTKADNKGRWRVDIITTNSKESQTIRITDEVSSVLLEDILFGEVWLCSGQSNMQQPLKGFRGQPTFGSVMAIAKSKNSNLRLFDVGRVGAKFPKEDLEKYSQWQLATPDSVSEFSAIAYFFGSQLQEVLDCPVGLIHASWGGSKVEAWMSSEVLSMYQQVDLKGVNATKRANQTPTALFNAMINPLIPFTIKGALWYQGESNFTQPEKYKMLFPAMINDWRARWNIGDFPFFYVQLPPYSYKNNEAFQSEKNSAFMREAQLECLDDIPNSGIVITMDLGRENFGHPPQKKEIADRLLFNALNQTYGFSQVACKSPVYKTLEVKEGGIELIFEHNTLGLYSFDRLTGFEIAGNDRVFYPANAEIVSKRKNVFVSSDKVPNPVAVRYGWRNWITASLYGGNLLPVSSFRTDDWSDATQGGN